MDFASTSVQVATARSGVVASNELWSFVVDKLSSVFSVSMSLKVEFVYFTRALKPTVRVVPAGTVLNIHWMFVY